MIRVTEFVHLRADADPEVVDRLVDAHRRLAGEVDAVAAEAAPTTPNSHNAGDVMLLTAYADDDSARTWTTRSLRHVGRAAAARAVPARHVETARYRQGPVDLREPALRDGIQRTLLVHVDPDTAAASVGRFEHDLRDMPRYIDSIRNSSLSRIDAVDASLGPAYTHVWEQEFVDLDGLTGPYMLHAYHWSQVDPWFDAQAPGAIVDPTLVHAACGLRRSILAHER